MLDPADLFELDESIPALGRPVLVLAMDGFVDAGGATKLAREHLLAAFDNEPVVTFDVDQLFDYRARRPEMIFASDHWESYTPPALTMHAVRDSAGMTFLLLSGPEPDVQWERFSAAVEQLVHQFDVRLVIGLNAIPMGVPHTRPIGVIAHGNPRSLVQDYTSWMGVVQVPASAGHLLEFRLGQAGVDAMGFAVNVPHYLANMEYPAAAATLIERIADAGDLELSTEALLAAAAATRVEVDKQIAASEQVAGVVHELERHYDELVAGRGPGLVPDGTLLPTADEIGAEFEQYLSQQPDAGDTSD